MKPIKGNYCDENSICPIVNDTTEGDWENEGGVVLPDVDDNSSREELDNWKKRYKEYGEWKKKIPMKELTRLEEEYNGCFDDRNWFDKDSRMVQKNDRIFFMEIWNLYPYNLGNI